MNSEYTFDYDSFSDLHKDVYGFRPRTHEFYFADQYGITMDIGAMRFNDNEFSTRVTAKTGDGTDAARNVWVQYQFSHDMKPSDFGREFVSNGETFRIAGFNPRSRKFPINAVRVRDGAKYKFPVAAVKRGIK